MKLFEYGLCLKCQRRPLVGMYGPWSLVYTSRQNRMCQSRRININPPEDWSAELLSGFNRSVSLWFTGCWQSTVLNVKVCLFCFQSSPYRYLVEENRNEVTK